jgi:hypothetical protein
MVYDEYVHAVKLPATGHLVAALFKIICRCRA